MARQIEPEPQQAAAVAALQSGDASGERTPLVRLDTHMSHVFLSADRAYKLIRARRHPFADLSTLEARRRACEAELALNRPLADGLYDAARPLVRTAGGALRLGGEGPVEGDVEDWVVVMRRFPDGALLSEMADAGRLTEALAVEAAEVAAGFHAGLPRAHDGGHRADYRRIIDGLRRTEAEGAAALGLSPAGEALFDALEHALARQAPLIEQRRRAGWVRRGHGDLHLRNICLFRGRVTPFDALEFDPALSTADVLYDIAFLLMDLRARGLPALANAAMNRYWDALGQDEAALALLPLFMGLRAAVRAAVAVEAGELAEAERYRRLGLALLAPAAPVLAAVGGLSGTGKSVLARALAPDLPGPCGARLLRSDVIRKAEAGVASRTRLGAAAYGAEARARIYADLAARARAAIEAGAAVIADATFRETAARAAIAEAAAGQRFLGLWLTAPAAVRVARVSGRSGDASDATAQVAAAQVEPAELGPGWRRLEASAPPAAVAAAARAVLKAAAA